MAQNSQVENTDKQFEILEAQIREIYGRVIYTHKTQEKCADIALKRLHQIKLAQIILSALTITGIFFTIFSNLQIGLIISTVLSTILLALNTYTKDYDLGEIAQKHADAANKLLNIRESYLSLLVAIKSRTLQLNEVIEKRDKLQSILVNVYSGSPRTFFKAYNEASKGLKSNEEFTFSNEEIDRFLPKELKKQEV